MSEDFNKLKPFRFWCQKVLPLVYDNSLSYYELLCKVVDYLNKTMEDVNSVIQLTEDFTEEQAAAYAEFTAAINQTVDETTREQAAAYAEFTAGINQTVDELTTAFNTLHDFVDGYFENLEVQEEIDNKLDEMATDGTLSAMFAPVATAMIPGLVTQWLNTHITPTSPPVDKTLTVSNAAADSKVVGTNFDDLKQRMSLEEEWEIPITHEDLIQGGYNSDGSLNQDGTNYLRMPQMVPIYPGMSMHFKGGAVIDRMKAGYFDPVTRRLDTSKDIPWFTGERTVTFDMYGLIIPIFRRASNTEVVPTDFDAEFKFISETESRIYSRVLYKNGGQTVSGDISSGTGLECDYNNQARKNLVITFSGKIPIGSTFTNLEIGLKLGSTKYNHLVIDSQNVTFTTMPDTVDTKPHGLNNVGGITKNIQVTVKTVLENKAIVHITSNGNSVDLEFTPYQQWRIGSAYAETSGSLTICTLSCVNQDIAKPVWFFGDSYTAYASNRWPFYADKWVNNILLDGYGGETSNYVITAFETYLGSGYPQYAVFATGMNDGSDTDVNTPNADWLSAIEEFIEICKDNQIIPVLCTVPTTPVYNNNGKNVYVRTSGYKYIDFAKAVGADGTGAWYAGMLGTDNIHPTVTGAKALCAQIEADFPEVFIQGVETDRSLTRFGVAADAGSTGERFDSVDTEIDGLKEDLRDKADAIVVASTGYENDVNEDTSAVDVLGPTGHTVSLFDTGDLISPVAQKIKIGTPGNIETAEYTLPNTIHLNGTVLNADTFVGLSTSGSNYNVVLAESLPSGTKLSFRAFIDGEITGSWPYINITVNGTSVKSGLNFDQTTRTAAFDYTASADVGYFAMMTKVVKDSVLQNVNISYACYADGQEVLIPAFNSEKHSVALSEIEGWNKVCSTPIQNRTETIVDTKTYIDEHVPEDYVKQSEIVDFLKRQELIYVMPEFFGAKGDGITDDTLAIQQCIDYAISHGNVPVKMLGYYKTTGTITVIADYQSLYLRRINNETSNPAFRLTGIYNRIKIDRISSTGDCFVLQSTDEKESNKNVIDLGHIYSRQARCIVLSATAQDRMYGNEFHFRHLSAKTNCIYHDTYSGGQHVFIGDGCSLASGSWAIVAGATTSRYISFFMEGYTQKGVYARAKCGGQFESIRTTEMLDQIGSSNEDLERGLFAKGPGVGGIRLLNTDMDYLGIDVSECESFLDLQESAATGDVRKNPLNYNQITRYGADGAALEDGTILGMQCFMPKNTKMCVWFDKKYVIPTEDFVYNVNQNVSIPNGGVFLSQQKIIPTVFNVTDNCEITLSESYNPIAIKRITVIQNANGKTAKVYDHNGNEIFDGSAHGNGVYVLACTIVPNPYSEGPTPYTFENLYLGTNEQWILEN